MSDLKAGAIPLTLVQDYGVNSSSCGYCGKPSDTSVSHGMAVNSMSVEAYQELLDRGWRRSGRWLYQPAHEYTCCQLVTIRLDVHKFQPNKDQRKVMRKWEGYLAGGPLRPGQPDPTNQADDTPVLLGGSPKRARTEPGALSTSPEQRGGGKRFRGSHENLNELEFMELARHDADHAAGALPRIPRPVSVSDQLTSIHINGGSPLDARTLANALAFEEEHAATAAAVLEEQEAGATSTPVSSEPAVALSSEHVCTLAAEALTQALGACITSGLIPELKFPVAKIQLPQAKQRKLLPANVVCTAACSHAVAGLMNQQHKKDSSIVPAPVSADQIASWLLQHIQLPPGLNADVLNGHINFSTASTAVNSSDRQQKNKSAAIAVPSSREPTSKIAATSAYTNGNGHPILQHHSAQVDSGGGGPLTHYVHRSVPRHFELRVVSSGDSSLVSLEFDLYRKYQVVHHNDSPSDVTPRSFKRFLCDTPLRPAPASSYPPGEAPPGGFGSFHQQYFLDGRLIAVGVVDVLPKCLSSKYLFWDPDFAPLSLGKLSSLMEIDWVKSAATSCPNLHFYYMGFYVHNCHRMRYKADFAPSDLLCPVAKCWVPIDRVKPALEEEGRPNLSGVPGALQGLGEEYLVENDHPVHPPQEPSEEEVGRVRLFVPIPGTEQKGNRGQVLTLKQLSDLGVLPSPSMERLKMRVREWMVAVGPVYESLLYQL